MVHSLRQVHECNIQQYFHAHLRSYRYVRLHNFSSLFNQGMKRNPCVGWNLCGEICILIHNERSIRINCRYKTDCILGESIERARIYGQELIYRLPTITQIYSLDIAWIGTINTEYTEYNTVLISQPDQTRMLWWSDLFWDVLPAWSDHYRRVIIIWSATLEVRLNKCNLLAYTSIESAFLFVKNHARQFLHWRLES